MKNERSRPTFSGAAPENLPSSDLQDTVAVQDLGTHSRIVGGGR